MQKQSTHFLLLFVLIMLGQISCANYNLYQPSYDQRLGDRMKRQIAREAETYPLLPEAGNEKIYTYVREIISTLLATDQIAFKEEFAWEVFLINDVTTLNAFVTPGGYIYVYTGLIKFLESEDQLAGVLAHEIAHADLRHASRQLSQRKSLSTVLLVANGGNSDLIGDIGASLVSLKFSRNFEKEADEKAISILCATSYKATGIAGFFEKLEAVDAKRLPAFLNTHPNPGKRVERIQASAEALACKGDFTNRKTYLRMKRWLE